MLTSSSLHRFKIPTTASDLENTPAEPILTEDRTHHLITSLHGILKPFLLRRLKTDVETNLPPKKEYILYAPLTTSQVDLYQAILAGKVRKYLIENIDSNGNFGTSSKKVVEEASSSATRTAAAGDAASDSESEEDEEGNRKMRLRRRDAIDYDTIDDDQEYFQRLERDPDGRSVPASEVKAKMAGRGRMKKVKTDAELGREFAVKEE